MVLKNHYRNDIVVSYVALLPTQALHANNIYPTKNDWVEITLLCRAVSSIGEKHAFCSAQGKRRLEARTATQGYRSPILFNASPPKTQSPITRTAKTLPTKTQMSIIRVAKLQHWTQTHGSRWSENWHCNVHRYQFYKERRHQTQPCIANAKGGLFKHYSSTCWNLWGSNLSQKSQALIV